MRRTFSNPAILPMVIFPLEGTQSCATLHYGYEHVHE